MEKSLKKLRLSFPLFFPVDHSVDGELSWWPTGWTSFHVLMLQTFFELWTNITRIFRFVKAWSLSHKHPYGELTHKYAESFLGLSGPVEGRRQAL